MSYLQKYAFRIFFICVLFFDCYFLFAQTDSVTFINTRKHLITDSLYNYISKPWIDSLIKRLNYKIKIINNSHEKISSDKKSKDTESLEKYNESVIRNLYIYVLDVFGPTIDNISKKPSNFLENFGNKIHIKTSEKIIKNNLLIKEGDKYNQKLIEENERVLRTLSFIEDAKFVVYNYDSLTNQVDVILLVKDLWPIGVGMELNNVYEGNLNIWNKNLFGYGREFGNTFSWNTLKSNNIGYEGNYFLSNISGTFIDAKLKYLENFKTRSYGLDIERNFISYKIKYGGGFKFEKTRTYHDIIFPDTIWTDTIVHYNLLNSWIGRNFILNNNNYENKFITLVLRFNKEKFYERPCVAKDFLYMYHNKMQMIGSMLYTNVSFKKDTFIYAFGRTEDVPKGYKLEITGGYEFDEFIVRPYIKSSLLLANHLKSKNSYLFYYQAIINFEGFLENKIINQGNIYTELSGFSKLINLNKWYLRTFLQCKYQLGINRYPEEFISIEDKSGIIGLKSTKLRGTQKFLINNEYVLISPFYLMGFRTAIFFNWNIGIIGKEGVIFHQNYYSSLSIGLRFRNENLTLNNIQINLSFYPRVPTDAIYKIIQASAGSINRFPNFYMPPQSDIGSFK